jgi:hypothetical protein
MPAFFILRVLVQCVAVMTTTVTDIKPFFAT